jgi:hypothetical protein
MTDPSSNPDKSMTASLKQRKFASDRRMRWKSTVIPDSLKRRHRSNIGQELEPENDTQARIRWKLCARNKINEGSQI